LLTVAVKVAGADGEQEQGHYEAFQRNGACLYENSSAVIDTRTSTP